MNIFNEEVINEFSKPLSEEVAVKAISWTESVLTDIINEIKAKTSVVSSNYEFVLFGDFITGATTINSEIDFYIAFKSPQLEFNSIKIVENKFRRLSLRIKRAWELSRQEKKSRKKTRKNKKTVSVQQEVEIVVPPNKYSIVNLKNDILKRLIKVLDDKSYIYVNNKHLKIVSRDNFGIDINIYPVIKAEDSYKLYDDYTGKFNEINLEQFKTNYNKKLRNAGDVYVGIVRVFKNIFFNVNNYHSSQFFMESVLFNVPDSLFEGYTFYEVFIKVLNYLKNARLETFVSILDKNKKLFSDKTISENIFSISTLIKHIDKLL